MDRPDIEWYKRRLNGYEGYTIRDLMIYTRMPALINYINQLEGKLNDTEELHKVRSGESPK